MRNSPQLSLGTQRIILWACYEIKFSSITQYKQPSSFNLKEWKIFGCKNVFYFIEYLLSNNRNKACHVTQKYSFSLHITDFRSLLTFLWHECILWSAQIQIQNIREYHVPRIQKIKMYEGWSEFYVKPV